MTVSSLATYTRVSSHNSGLRTNSICRFTPHCIVGQWTAKFGVDYFAETNRSCSANYVVGTNGDCACSVPEEFRAWTTSSNWNDQRAITVECASDTTHPFAMNSKVYEKLIQLCVDVCKRYGKTKILWFADRNTRVSYIPMKHEMVLTCHRDFTSTACMGDWLYARMPEFAKEVQKRLDSGAIKHGWKKNSKGWWYEHEDGSYPVLKWEKIKGIWYYFDAKGYAYHNEWMKYKEEWYYFDNDCHMVTDKWIKWKDKWYYCDSEGKMVTGWLKNKNEWYFLDVENGDMKTGFVEDGVNKYYCRPKKVGEHPEGSMVTGWLKVDGKWYFFTEKTFENHPKGSMYEEEWLERNGNKYYLKENGVMAENETLVIDDVEYTFNKEGELI